MREAPGPARRRALRGSCPPRPEGGEGQLERCPPVASLGRKGAGISSLVRVFAVDRSPGGSGGLPSVTDRVLSAPNRDPGAPGRALVRYEPPSGAPARVSCAPNGHRQASERVVQAANHVSLAAGRVLLATNRDPTPWVADLSALNRDSHRASTRSSSLIPDWHVAGRAASSRDRDAQRRESRPSSPNRPWPPHCRGRDPPLFFLRVSCASPRGSWWPI